MSIAEWHKSKLENPFYRSNIRYVTAYTLGMTPLIWTMFLGYGSTLCVTESLRHDYGPRIGNDSMACAFVLLPAAALLCFRSFWILARKSMKVMFWVSVATNILFVVATICSTSPRVISAL